MTRSRAVLPVFVAACWTGPVIEPTSTPTVPPKVEVSAPADAGVVKDDTDGDRVVGECDLCPDRPETHNGILDADGCPDSSGISHAVMLDPTNEYATPVATITFRGQKATNLEKWPLESDVEVVAAVGRAPSSAVARARAATIVNHLRSYLPKTVQVEQLATTAADLYDDPSLGNETPNDGVVQVLRADGTDVWRWNKDHFERATPPMKLGYSPKLPAKCNDLP